MTQTNKTELRITIPEGYEIDKENSTFECIKFKKTPNRWREENDFVNGYTIINDFITKARARFKESCIFFDRKQAKSALAMSRISQIMANDKKFGGVVTDKEWTNIEVKYTIARFENRFAESQTMNNYAFLAFHTAEQRDLFLEENEDLVKDYLMID